MLKAYVFTDSQFVLCPACMFLNTSLNSLDIEKGKKSYFGHSVLLRSLLFSCHALILGAVILRKVTDSYPRQFSGLLQ